MKEQTVLISGAGIAGSTLAWWLARRGFRPTVVERAQGLRSSGNPVDVRGEALRVAVEMGLVPRLTDAATGVTRATIVDGDGRRVASVGLGGQRSSASPDIEIARSGLAAILTESASEDAEYVFHDSIVSLTQDSDGVDVEFERGPSRRFDLVVGTDGLHSTVRRLVFGPEGRWVRPLGLYVATLRLHEHPTDPTELLLYNTPGRSLSVHPAGGRPVVAFIFRGREAVDFGYRDVEAQKRFITDAYAGGEWRTTELLEKVATTDDLYFDAVSRVVLPAWSRGRITLLGDAASSVSLFGEGSSMAMIGARTLAEALAAQPDDPMRALASYEAVHRKRVRPHQRFAGTASHLIVPATAAGLAVRNTVARAASHLPQFAPSAGRDRPRAPKRGRMPDSTRARS